MPEIRNIAIIAHVDHGKTTLIDFLLRQAGTFAAHQRLEERMMDSMDLERERGITILSKCTALTYDNVRINVVDTPGHADFGGEVERILAMVEGALLLVDASEGPLPQTRFVLEKALAAGLTIIVCINKIDRPDARISEVVNEVYDLFIDLGADDRQIDFPLLYATAREGTCGVSMEVEHKNLRPLFEAIVRHIPAPSGSVDAPLQFVATQLDHDSYVGRLAIGRIRNGRIRERDEVGRVDAQGQVHKVKVNQLYIHQGLKRVPVLEALNGEIIALAGVDEVEVGDSLTDLNDPRPLPRIRVEEPTISVNFSNNDSPFSGRDGKYVTARKIRERLEKELLHNVALRMEETGNTDSYRVFGRGELQLCILIEQMRREGFEMCVSKPEVVTRVVDGQVQEPFELAVLDLPEPFLGVVTRKMAARKGRMQEMRREMGDRVRLTYHIPARGLIGLRGEFLNDTRGTGLMHTLFNGYGPDAGYILYRQNGSLIADRPGPATQYALFHLQPRGQLFISPGTEVYEGMIVGENARGNDMNVNVCRTKHLTNIRAAGSDEKLLLTPPTVMTLEMALEYIAEDELVEITPNVVRMRKRVLAHNLRSIIRGPREDA